MFGRHVRFGIVAALLTAAFPAIAQLSVPGPPTALVPPGVVASIPGPPITPRNEFAWRSYRHFTTADGLSNLSILALAQGNDGFVYAGTEVGLSRYDGVRWQDLDLPQHAHRPVRALRALADGSLWIGIDGLGLWRRDSHAAWQQPRSDSNADATITDIVPADAERQWVAGSDGLRLCGRQP